MTKLEKMAKQFDRIHTPDSDYSDSCIAGFKAGAMAMIEMLRSDFAPINIEPFYPYNESWAQWLESECAKDVE